MIKWVWMRTEYKLTLKINSRVLSRVVIDQHYKEKHSDVSDEIILELINQINGRVFEIDSQSGDFQYFTVEPVFSDSNPYRLVLLLCMNDDFLGVINAFRVQRSKYE